MRFRWVKNCDPNQMQINRFARLVFGLTESLFIFESTLKVHFHNCLTNYPKVIEKIADDMHVDALTSGGNTQKFEELFKMGGFNLKK